MPPDAERPRTGTVDEAESEETGNVFEEPSRTDGILGALFADAHEFGFFQAVWLAEQLLDADDSGDVFEVRPRRTNGRIRIRPYPSPVFPASDVRAVTYNALDADARPSIAGSDGPTVDVTVTFMSLFGVNAPLPSYFVEHVVRASDDSEALRAFLEMFNHRIYTLLYRGWKKYRPLLAADAARRAVSSPGRVGQRASQHVRAFQSLAGLGIHSAAPPTDRADPGHLHWAAFAGRLSGHVRNREGLEMLVSQTLGVPTRVLENVGRWAPLRERPAVGGRSPQPMTLGRGGVVGGRLFDVAGKFRLVLGPLDLATYQSLRPGGEGARLLQAVVDLYLHDALDFDVELRLDPDELSPAALSDKRSRVGSTARLGRAPDTVAAEIVAYA